jgi:predicted nucleic acid-binding protein
MTITERCFGDTNILVYWSLMDGARTEIAKRIMDEGLVISAQVLNEFASVARGKFKVPWESVVVALESAKERCTVVPVALETHERAMEIAQDHKIHIYDACIVAAAELAGCDVLYTEDMNHGQRIGAVEIRNPFVAA